MINNSKGDLNLTELEVLQNIKKEVNKKELNSKMDLYPKCLIRGIIKDLIIEKENLILSHKETYRPDLEVIEGNRLKVLKSILDDFDKGQYDHFIQ